MGRCSVLSVLLLLLPGQTLGLLAPARTLTRPRPLNCGVPDLYSPPGAPPPAPVKPKLSLKEGDFGVESSMPLSSVKNPVMRNALALYKFTRPHTIRGTVLASVAGTARVLIDSPGYKLQWGMLLPRAFIGMGALLLGNAFIVGINQIFDKGIDEVNKPFLPVASGEMSVKAAWFAVTACGILGPVTVAAFFRPLIFKLYMLGWVVGAAYSVPPLRTKRNPIAAAATIALVRGFLLNFGVYYSVKEAIGAPFTWSPKVAFIARFMTVFASVIAVTKDLPDIEGDKMANISTFAIRVGTRRIALGAVAALGMNYVSAIIQGIVAPAGTFRRAVMVGGHGLALGYLVAKWRGVDTESMPSIKRFYKNIWDVFYFEYLLYALM